MIRCLSLMSAVLALGLVSCNRNKPAITDASTGPVLAGLPATLSLQQRSTAPVPGSNGNLLLTIADITRGKVLVNLAGATGEVVMPSRAMSSGQNADFGYGNTQYRLTLARLKNSLLGEDSADFVISAATNTAAPAPNEAAKIEKLIEAVTRIEGAKFVRNGSEHDASNAASHLRAKWQASDPERMTAEQFITEIASKSSTSGEVYQIRFPDGHTVPAGEFLRERLVEMGSR
jgi:hypothetical protein